METDLPNSFNEQYANVTNKLKKRFMRKPNVSEAKNELQALAIQCENSEQPAFAGQCYATATKCDSLLGDFLGEAESYLAAARQFMKAEIKLCSLHAFSPARENLEASINSYIQASSKYPDKSPLKTAILIELAQNLVKLRHLKEAIYYYEQALDMLNHNQGLALQCMIMLVDLHIRNCDYESALEISSKICDMDKTIVRASVCTEQEVNRILLTMIVELPNENIPPSLKLLLQQLSKGESNKYLDELFSAHLRIQLESIVIAFETKDIEALIESITTTKDHFTLLQQELLHTIIEINRNKY